MEKELERKVFVAIDENNCVVGYFPNWINYRSLPENGCYISEEEYNKLDKSKDLIKKDDEFIEAPKKPLTYAEKRLMEYPSLPEQLDMIFHDIDAWKATISAIKAKYPKDAG